MSLTPRNGPSPDPALRVRVDTVEREIAAIETQVNAIQREMATRSDMADLRTSIASLAVKYESSARPNWQAWGVAATCVIALGALAYWPIREKTSDTQAALVELAGRSVSRREFDDILRERRVFIDANAKNTDKLFELQRQQVEQIARNNADIQNLNGRLDAISRRLAEFIRDMGRH